MKDEIKDLLQYLKNVYESEETSTWLNKLQIKDLLDYITNLQEENERLKKNQRYYKKGVFSLEYDKETLTDMVDDLQHRIDKAIENLKKTKELNDKHILARDNIVVHLDIDHIDYLLNILQGSDE